MALAPALSPNRATEFVKHSIKHPNGLVEDSF